MPQYQVTAYFKITAPTATAAENIVQNAVEATEYHIETEDVTADLDPYAPDDEAA